MRLCCFTHFHFNCDIETGYCLLVEHYVTYVTVIILYINPDITTICVCICVCMPVSVLLLAGLYNSVIIHSKYNLKAFLFCSTDLKGQIDSLAKEYTSNARTISSEQKLSILRQIQQSYSKCKEFGDDKVQLAMQTYEMVSSS